MSPGAGRICPHVARAPIAQTTDQTTATDADERARLIRIRRPPILVAAASSSRVTDGPTTPSTQGQSPTSTRSPTPTRSPTTRSGITRVVVVVVAFRYRNESFLCSRLHFVHEEGTGAMRRVASRRDAMGSRGARYWIWAALCAVSCADVARAARTRDWCTASTLTNTLTYATARKTASTWQNDAVARMFAGETINVGVIWDPGVVKADAVASTDTTTPSPFAVCEGNAACGDYLDGPDYAIFQEVAQRGGFTANWTLFRDKLGTETYDNLVTNITLNYDVSGQWWTDSSARRAMGIASSQYFQDLSRMLVVKKTVQTKTFQPDLLLKPFTWQAWVMFLSLTTFHAMCYYYLEFEYFKQEIPHFWEGFMTSLWLSWERFTSGLDAEPRSPHAKILQAIWGMCTLCFTALYTASLAALIIEVSTSNSAINSMNDLRSAGSTAVMFQNDPLIPQMQIAYDWLTIVEKPRTDILAVQDLDAFLTSAGAYALLIPATDAYKVVQSSPDCSVTETAMALQSGGGFVAHYSGCAENFLWNIDTILMEMAADGTIDRIKSRYATLKCASDDSATTISYQLGIEQTVGIVVAGAALMIFVLVVSATIKNILFQKQQRAEAALRSELDSEMAKNAPASLTEDGGEAEISRSTSLMQRRTFKLGRAT